LLCFKGDYPKTDTHLDLIGSQDQKYGVAVALFRQLVRAATARRQFHAEGRVPEFLTPASDELKLRLRASIELREGRSTEAASLLSQAEALRPKVQGTCNGQPFDDLRDLDDLCASFLEVLTSTGKYYWVPLAQVARLELRPLGRLRDLLWRPASLKVHQGPSGEVFLPVLYAGSDASDDPRIQLGRATDWIGQPVRGIGQRELLVGTSVVVLSDIQTLEVPEAAA
jgi:type VI secretion system protein ImpE